VEDEGITDVIKITLINPGFSYEKNIGKLQSLYAQAFMNTSFGIGYSSSLGNTSYVHFDPAISLQYRYYYNLNSRLAKGKRTEMNSLNYLTSIIETTFSKGRISPAHFDETKRRAINALGLAWGFQRNYPRRFSLDLNFGAGYLYGKVTTMDLSGQSLSKNSGRFTTVGQFNLGFWLNRKK
jgi:hypothetical protein